MSTCCGRLKRKMPRSFKKRQRTITLDATQKGPSLGHSVHYCCRCCPRPEHYSEATMFPHNIGLGCANDPDLMRRIGRVTALELRAVGFAWILAPVTAVPLSTGADIRSKAHAKSLHITDGSGVHRRSARGRGNRHWCGSYVQAFPG
mmetsp:Transcript_50447/g.126411  ORF Transcript_50447/g.126411 Transcript_50447/m.126411 type:complete len:147 (+) Transcript_50447:692-1132(+)